MNKNYGELLFDSLLLSKKLDELIQQSKDITLEEKVNTQINKDVHSLTLSSETQKVSVLKTTDLIIYTVTKYVLSSILPRVIEEYSKDHDISKESGPELYKRMAAEMLQTNNVLELIFNHTKEVMTKADDYIKTENYSENLDIDKVYSLPQGGMIGIALEVFTRIIPDKESYTHLIILDDLHGYIAIASLDPKNIVKPEEETK